ncbi:hypothetical protein TNCV_447931 [Trichonephila clavipes]|nr:hypothetical protein TNCV_447931 [Trichonephila clavipes]
MHKSVKPLYKLAVIARESFSARLSSLIIPALQERQCLQITIFMQNGATRHIGRQVKAMLSSNFGDSRVIQIFSGCMTFSLTRLKSVSFLVVGFLIDRVCRGGIGTFT